MSTAASLDVEVLRGWIGREQVTMDLLGEDLARKYHAMLDLPGEAPRQGEPASGLIHFCLAQPAVPTSRLGADGHPERGGFLPPVPLPRRMWAGGFVVFHGDLRVGDAVRRSSRIEDVTMKQGRTGTLCFVTVLHRIEVAGEAVVEERQDIVYRGLDTGHADKATPQAKPGEWTRRLKATPTLLFRYSALTFNGHRTHYDRRFATEVEGYPGLVVHGPLQAAMLLNYASELRGRHPKRFEFRSLSPLFDDDPFTLNASDGQDEMKLHTAREAGPVSMSATASW